MRLGFLDGFISTGGVSKKLWLIPESGVVFAYQTNPQREL